METQLLEIVTKKNIYGPFARCSIFLISVSLIAATKTEAATIPLEPSPSVTSRIDQLQTVLQSSDTNNLPTQSAPFTSRLTNDDVPTATPALSSVVTTLTSGEDDVMLQIMSSSREDGTEKTMPMITPSEIMSQEEDLLVVLTSTLVGSLLLTTDDLLTSYNGLPIESTAFQSTSLFAFNDQSLSHIKTDSEELTLLTSESIRMASDVSKTLLKDFISTSDNIDVDILTSAGFDSQFSTISMSQSVLEFMQPSSLLPFQLSEMISSEMMSSEIGRTDNYVSEYKSTYSILESSYVEFVSSFEDLLSIGDIRQPSTRSGMTTEGMLFSTIVQTVSSYVDMENSDIVISKDLDDVTSLLQTQPLSSSVTYLAGSSITPVDYSSKEAMSIVPSPVTLSGTTVLEESNMLLSSETFWDTMLGQSAFSSESQTPSFISVYESYSFDGSRVSATQSSPSQFQTPSLTSMDIGQYSEEHSLIQVTTLFDSTEVPSVEPIIICFTTIVTLPSSMATFQFGGTLNTPDITLSEESSTQSRYWYSTDINSTQYNNWPTMEDSLKPSHLEVSSVLQENMETTPYMIWKSITDHSSDTKYLTRSDTQESYQTTFVSTLFEESLVYSTITLEYSSGLEAEDMHMVSSAEVDINTLGVHHVEKRAALVDQSSQIETEQSLLMSSKLEPLTSLDLQSSILTSGVTESFMFSNIETSLDNPTATDMELIVTTTLQPTLFAEPSIVDSSLREILDIIYATSSGTFTETMYLSSFTGTLLPSSSETPSLVLDFSSLLERSDMLSGIYTSPSINLTTQSFSPSLSGALLQTTESNFSNALDISTFISTIYATSLITLSDITMLQTLSSTPPQSDNTFLLTDSVMLSPTFSEFSSSTLLPTISETPPIIFSSIVSERSSTNDVKATATQIDFSNLPLLSTFSETPVIFSSSLSESLGSNNVNVTATQIGFSELLLLSTVSETPPIIFSSSLSESLSSNNVNATATQIGFSDPLLSTPIIESFSVSEVFLVEPTTSELSKYLEETFIVCTTIYPSTVMKSSEYSAFTSEMKVPSSDQSSMTSTVKELMTLEPSTFSISDFSEVITPSPPGASNSLTKSSDMSLLESELIIETVSFTTSNPTGAIFSSETLETSVISTLLVITDIDVMSSTSGLDATFLFSDSSSLMGSVELPSSSATPNMLTTFLLSASPSSSRLPEQSSSSSSVVFPSSSSSAPTSSRSLVTPVGTTKKSYVTLDTSFGTKPAWLQLEFEVPVSVDIKSLDFISEIERRLASAYIQARSEELGSRRRRAVTVEDVTTQQIDISRDDANPELLSVVYYIVEGGERIPASQSAATMQFLSSEALSITLGYPVETHVVVYDESSSNRSIIWIVAVICGVLAFIFLVCCCFCWCCRPRPRDGNFDPETLKFLQFKQKYPYHSYAASKRRQGAMPPTGLDNSHSHVLEDDKSVKTSDYHTDEDDSGRVKENKRHLTVPPRMLPRATTIISRQDDVVSELDSLVSSTEEELRMSSSVSSQVQLHPKLSKNEQMKDPKRAMFSHVSEHQMQSKPKKSQRTIEEAKKQKNGEAEWRQAQAEISAILEPEVVKTQALTTFVAPHKRKKKIKDKKKKQKSSHASSSIDETEIEEDGIYNSLPDVHYARPLASENENTQSLGQTRKRMHALLDEAFSLVNLPPAGRNAVRPLQSTAHHSSMKDLKKPSKSRERRRQRLSSTETHETYTGSETDDSVFKSRHPFVKHQKSAPVGFPPKDEFTQTKTDPGKVVIVPITKLGDDTGGLVWSIYDAEDEVSRLTPTMEPATIPGGLDPSPPVTIRSPTGALLTLPQLSMLPESELTTRNGPPVPLKQFKKTKSPTYDEAETSFQQSYNPRPYRDRLEYRPVSLQGSAAYGLPTKEKRPAIDMLASLEKEKRIGKPVDDSFDELNVTAIIKGADTPQPLMKVIKEELERLAKLRPHTYEEEDML
ncbi:uncharacterized protein [Antedon mediterranea]|uniref:uncharacterized protein n=1 Tax=Antedon mediterranea TaxID=105859 RepID=UPI003AF986E7